MFLFGDRAASLPTDANRESRQRDLQERRNDYDYSRSPSMTNLVINQGPVPKAEFPSPSWIMSYIQLFSRLKLNLIEGGARLKEEQLSEPGGATSKRPSAHLHLLGDIARVLGAILPTAIGKGKEAAAQNVQMSHGSQLTALIQNNVATAEAAAAAGAPVAPDDAIDDPSISPIHREAYHAIREYRAMVDLEGYVGASERQYFETFTTDTAFARARVAGLNPMSLRAVSAADVDEFKKLWMRTDSNLLRTFGGSASQMFSNDTIEEAQKDNRLYMLEYKWLEAAPDSEHDHRFIYIPKALFAVPKDSKDRKKKPLVPIAIRIYRKGKNETDAKLYTPKDGFSWQIAKLIITVLDGNDHEYYQHLTLTHLLLEPFGIAVKRQLHPSHPLSRLLEPHFEGTIFINRQAVQVLLAENGGVDKNMMAPIKQMAPVLNEKLARIPFHDQFLEMNLKARGVTDEKLHFPYRDYARPLWVAISTWVESYVKEFYDSDDAVAGDTELQAWAREIAVSQIVTIDAFGDKAFLEGKSRHVISSLSYLVEALTMIIFTASCQHSALNFAQKPFLAFAPAWPLAMKNGELPPSGVESSSVTCVDWKRWLPTYEETQVQWNINQMLGGLHCTKLGVYPSNVTAGKPALKSSLSMFQKTLIEIGRMIEEREEGEKIKYLVLHPDGISASINI